MDNQQVMGNEQIGNAQLLLQLFKHVDDLCLNGNIQCTDCFVTDDKSWIGGKCSRNTDTLSLTAGKLMCITGCMLCIQTDQLHQMQDLVSSFPSGGVKLVHLSAHMSDALFIHSLPIEKDVAGGRCIQTQQRSSYSRLAAAGFSYQTEGFSRLDGKGNAVHRF